MNAIYWLGIAYGIVLAGLALYLASLGFRQRKIIQKLEELEGTNNE